MGRCWSVTELGEAAHPSRPAAAPARAAIVQGSCGKVMSVKRAGFSCGGHSLSPSRRPAPPAEPPITGTPSLPSAPRPCTAPPICSPSLPRSHFRSPSLPGSSRMFPVPLCLLRFSLRSSSIVAEYAAHHWTVEVFMGQIFSPKSNPPHLVESKSIPPQIQKLMGHPSQSI